MNDTTMPAFGRRSTNAEPGWLAVVAEAYAIRSGLYFSARRRFDDALRPALEHGVIAYPDAFYNLTQTDLDRAKRAINNGSI